MSRFFKNYDKIDLDVFNNVKKSLDDNEIKELDISPKYLAMINIKHCDFCKNVKNENTKTELVNFFLGYQICNDCSIKDIGKTFIKSWYIENNHLPLEYFMKNSDLIKDKDYIITRSNGKIEKNWMLDLESELTLIKKDDLSEDLLIKLYSNEPLIRSITKHIFLSELCRFNDLNEYEIILKFKELFEIFKNN